MILKRGKFYRIKMHICAFPTREFDGSCYYNCEIDSLVLILDYKFMNCGEPVDGIDVKILSKDIIGWLPLWKRDIKVIFEEIK